MKALPYLRYFTCCLKKPKKDFRLALRKALLKKMDLRMPKSDIQLEEDPFLRLGTSFSSKKSFHLIFGDAHLSYRIWYGCLFWYSIKVDPCFLFLIRCHHSQYGYLCLWLRYRWQWLWLHHLILIGKYGYLFENFTSNFHIGGAESLCK